MTDYCFSLSVDGREQPMRSQAFDSEQAAIEHGRSLLMMTVRFVRPPSAYCTVFESAGTDTEPLGAWDYSGDNLTPRWSAEA